MNNLPVIAKMKNIRDRLGKERVHRLTERKETKQRRNDTKELFIYEENGVGSICPGGSHEPGLRWVSPLSRQQAGQQEGNNWAYYNNNGSKVTNAWRQAQDGTWRYLESSGAMAADKWVDNDDYYVDSSGIMITNKWLQVANSRKASGYDWYYFGTNGKCLKENGRRLMASTVISVIPEPWRLVGSSITCTTATIPVSW